MRRLTLAVVAMLLGVLVGNGQLAHGAGPIERVSLTSTSGQAAGGSFSPRVSADGRYVVFVSGSPDLTPGDNEGTWDVFLRDRQAGTTVKVSTGLGGAPGNAIISGDLPEISCDVRYVVFESEASNLVAGDTNGARDIFLWDRETGQMELISVNSDEEQSNHQSYGPPAVTCDGRFVVFQSLAYNLVPWPTDRNGSPDIYVRDRQAQTTELISWIAPGLEDETSGEAGSGTLPDISDDGRFVVFRSTAPILVAGDTNDMVDIFVRDRQESVTFRANLTSTGAEAANVPWHLARDQAGIISGNGRYVAFPSLSADLAPGDTNGCQDVYIPDLVAATNRLLSVNRYGSGSGNGPSSVPLISADGRYVVFVSAAEDLVANDANKREDVFARDTVAGATLLASVGVNGWSGNRAALSPSISADGRRVVFESTASGLVSGDADVDQSDIFLHDLTAGTTTLVSVNISGDPFSTGYYTMPTISPDGRFVAFRSNSGATVFVKDLQSGSSTPVATNITSLSFSGNSRVFAAICGVRGSSTSRELVVADLLQGTNTSLALISGASSGTQGRLSLNDNGRFVAFTYMNPSGFGYGYLVASDTNNLEDVFLYDVATANLMLVSVSQTGIAPGNNRSNWPRLSADGRYLAFRSAADDLVPGDANGKKDVFLFDRLTGQKTVLSSSFDGIATANGMSLGLEMTPDARLIVFNSVATDLVHGDFNGSMDVFAVGVEQTVPTNQLPVIKLSDLALTSSRTTVSWTVVPGRAYRVQFKDSLDEPEWHDLADRVRVVGSTASYYDASSTGLKQRFYRLLSGD